MTTYDVRCACVTHHAEMAARAFANHVVTQTLDSGLFRHWRCARPDECAYAFNVTTMPGRIIVTGDVGTLVLERTEDMIAWCRGSINSIDYFAEKVVREIETEVYDPDVALAWINDRLADAERELSDEQRAELEGIRNMLDEIGEEGLCRELIDTGIEDGCDLPNFKNFASSFLWCRECIKFLLSRIA